MVLAAKLVDAAAAVAKFAAAAAWAETIALSNCAALLGVTDAAAPLDDLPLTVFDCEELDDVEVDPVPDDEPEPLEPELEEPELPEPLEPDEPELEPVVDPVPELEPLLLEDMLPAITTLFANKLIPPVLPPVLVIEPLELILCAVAVT